MPGVGQLPGSALGAVPTNRSGPRVVRVVVPGVRASSRTGGGIGVVGSTSSRAARSTAKRAFTSPDPVSHASHSGRTEVVPSMTPTICRTVRPGASSRTSARTPETCGVDMLVPLIDSYPVSGVHAGEHGTGAVIRTPGAETAGRESGMFRARASSRSWVVGHGSGVDQSRGRPRDEKATIWDFLVIAATPMTYGETDSLLIVFSPGPLFPAAKTLTIPLS